MSDKSAPNEFDLIKRFFVPLTKNIPGAFALSDDAAVLSLAPGLNMVVTMDAMVSGVHFLADTPPGDIAAKLLRVNLSDLAAMGATPYAYTLSLALHQSSPSENVVWLEQFADGLSREQALWNISLIGGDTVSTPGALTLSLTALGTVSAGKELRRSGAVAGDAIFVSGTLGDAALGLSALKGERPGLGVADREYLVNRHRRPNPRLALGNRLGGLAGAVIDISDGLVADLEHICQASDVSATVEAGNIPLSPPTRFLFDQDPNCLNAVLAGGDDYELLFTAARHHHRALATLAVELELPITEIGRIHESAGDQQVKIIDKNGQTVDLVASGYRHF